MQGFLFALAGILLAAPACAMPVSTFLGTFQKLEGAGKTAVYSSDAAALKKELHDSAAALHSERLVAVQAGKAPAYCPVAGVASPTFDEIMGALKAVPAARQSKTEVKDALRAYLAKRFPCGK